MRRSRMSLGIAAAVLLAIGGAALASNMAFKFVPHMDFADPDYYDISIPDVNNYTDLVSVFDDVNTSPGCTALSVCQFHNDIGTACCWNGPFSCNESLGGSGFLRVSVGPPGFCRGWVIVGANGPSGALTGVNLVGPDPNPPGDPILNWLGLPYNSVAMTILDVFNEINTNGVPAGQAASVTVFHPDNTSCTWNGAFSCTEPLPSSIALKVTIRNSGVKWRSARY